MKSHVLISICIPAFNASEFIAETLNSIGAQSYLNWEVIVIEDGSSDGTQKIVEEFNQSVSQKIIYRQNERNLGLPATRNIAASFSGGEWIAFLDSDDLWHKDHLSDLINTASNNPECEFIHSGAELFDSKTRKILSIRAPDAEAVKQFPHSLFSRTYNIQPSAIMISRSLFKITKGFNENLRYCEDLEMWFRCAKNNFQFAFTGKNTCHYRQHESGALSTHSDKMAWGAAQVFEIHSDWSIIPQKIRTMRASQQWLAAARIFRKTDKKVSKEFLKNSMRHQVTFVHFFYWILIYGTRVYGKK